MRRLARLVAIVSSALVLVTSCQPAGPNSSTTTSTTKPTTTTTVEPTTTTIPVADTLPFTDPQDQDLLFDLTGITSGRVTAYSGPGTNYDGITSFPAGVLALESTGKTEESIDGTVWREIHTFIGQTAWVDTEFLSLNETAAVSFREHPCSKFGTIEGELARAGPSSSDADHVAQMWQVSWPDCTRIVILLGRDFTFAGSSPLANTIPTNVSVEAFGTWARVELPGIGGARLDAGEDIGDVTAVVARTLAGQIVVDVHAGGPGEYFAQFLTNPARIVIDVLPANVAATVLTDAVVGSGVVVAEPLPPGASLPLTISGYSRWFEAAGNVVVRRAADDPGTGEVVSARVTGEFVIDPGSGTHWGVTATDWLDAWGIFTFELDGLGPGDYEIFIGECAVVEDADSCEDAGLYLPLNVGS
jgi:hypothetical protein